MDDKTEAFIESLEQIEIKKPTDLIIQQIKRQISSGMLKPGDKLPPEREISKRLSVGRGYVREAIKKLEFYGILKTIPHKGTIVSSLGVKALEGLISNVLELEKENFRSLVETRLILETNTARLAALRAADNEIEKIQKAHDDYRELALKGTPNIEIDFLFHLRIAEFCKNPVLHSIITLITPDIISYSMSIAGDRQVYLRLSKLVVDEHRTIMNAIRNREAEKSADAMRKHLNRVLTLVTEIEQRQDAFDIDEWIENYKKQRKIPEK
ncbi:FCD domain-containing protein [candidate division KSB1 bacterium]|nr:FCD domain-containing protein [candidate division KSB1 bacterium]